MSSEQAFPFWNEKQKTLSSLSKRNEIEDKNLHLLGVKKKKDISKQAEIRLLNKREILFVMGFMILPMHEITSRRAPDRAKLHYSTGDVFYGYAPLRILSLSGKIWILFEDSHSNWKLQ